MGVRRGGEEQNSKAWKAAKGEETADDVLRPSVEPFTWGTAAATEAWTAPVSEAGLIIKLQATEAQIARLSEDKTQLQREVMLMRRWQQVETLQAAEVRRAYDRIDEVVAAVARVIGAAEARAQSKIRELDVARVELKWAPMREGIGCEVPAEKCKALEDQVADLQAQQVMVQQQCDRTVAETRLQAQQSKQAELRLAEELAAARRDRLIVDEKLEAANASVNELHEELADIRSVMTQAELSEAAQVEQLEEERERARRAQRMVETLQAQLGNGIQGSSFEEAARRQIEGNNGSGEAAAALAAARSANTYPKGGVVGDELMKLLERAWEEGREAAEKRLAFERAELEAQWARVKGLKREEASAKNFIKAIAKGRVW